MNNTIMNTDSKNNSLTTTSGGEVNEQDNNAASIPNNCIFTCINTIFGFGSNSPKEATGLSLDIAGRAVVAMSSTLLGPALLQLASDAAGCVKTTDENDVAAEVCTLKIYGMRPSSLMTNIAAISGIIVCIMLPLFGSIIDHTKYRRHVGIYTAIIVTVFKGIEISINQNTWFFIACLQVFLVFFYNVHLLTSYAYIAELSNNTHVLSRYNSSFFTILFIVTVLFLIVVIGIGMVLQLDDIGIAWISQIIVTFLLIIVWTIAWKYYLPNRPALNIVPTGRTVVSAGFYKLYTTLKIISLQNIALLFFLLSVAFSEAASFALITISTTYMKIFLQMNASEIGYVILVVLISGIPGSIVGNVITKNTTSPLYSVLACDVLFILSTVLAAIVLNGPERKGFAYIFAILWGVGLGWLHPQHIAVYCGLIPNGSEAELMGIFLFCTYAIGWLPPLVFSVLNENEISMAWGLASLSFYFIIAILLLSLMIFIRKTITISTLDNLSTNTSTTNSKNSRVTTNEDTELQDLRLKESVFDQSI